MSFSIVSYGETLWDLLPTGPVLGGAPFNFAYRVNTLGNRGTIITRLGNDENGRKAFNAIDRLGMTTEAVQWDDDHPTGTVEITLDENRQPDYFIVPDVAYDYIDATAVVETAVRNADCLCFGTLSQRSPVSRSTLRRLISLFDGTYRVLDINLRKKCYTRETVLSSIEHADILKLNETEIVEVAGYLGIESRGIPETAEHMLETGHLQIVVVTLGEKGAFAVSQHEEGVYCPGYRVDLKDPCGSGDAFTGAFLTSLLNREPLALAVEKGNALGALVAAQEGATGSISPDTVKDFLSSEPEEQTDPELISLKE